MIAGGLGRRGLLQGALATTASMALIDPRPADARTHPLDPANSGDIALIYRKLAFSMSDEPGYWWLKGRRYGLVDAELTPLWDMHIGIFFKTRNVSDAGQFDVTSVSISFYTDIDNGEFITNVKNPFTGKMVAVNYFPPKAETVRFDNAGRMDSGAGPGGLVSSGTIGPAWIEGDQVWVQGDHILRRDASTGVSRIRVNDMTTYFGGKRDVADKSVKSAPAGQTFSDINTWPSWLEMGAQPGSYYSRVFGHKVASYERMPQRFRQLMLSQHPNIANDPPKFLEG